MNFIEEDSDYHAIYMYDKVVLIVRSPHTSSRYLIDRDTKVRSVVNIYCLQDCKMISEAEVDMLTVIGDVPVVPITQFERWVISHIHPGFSETVRWDDNYYHIQR